MHISVESTLTPLQDDYEPAMVNFIKNLKNPGLDVKENPLHTQIYNDYNQVLSILQKEMEKALVAMERGLFYIKIVKSDRSGYVPFF